MAAIGVFAGCIGLAIAAAHAYDRARRHKNGQARGHKDRQTGDGGERQLVRVREPQQLSDAHGRSREWPQSPGLRAALRGALAGLAVAGRNSRDLGFRVFDLRRVDARTGGPVSVGSALAGVLFDQAWQAAAKQLFGSQAQRQRESLSALAPQLQAVAREHADDAQAQNRAVMELYEANGVSPFPAGAWQLAGVFAAQLMSVLGSRGGRTVRDRVTGTRVIAGG